MENPDGNGQMVQMMDKWLHLRNLMEKWFLKWKSDGLKRFKEETYLYNIFKKQKLVLFTLF
jgi:hypothetical protein